jgi:hypothetical protein
LTLLPETHAWAAPSGAFIDTVYALCVAYSRLLPVVLGAIVLAGAARRRLHAGWPIAGAAAVDLFAGTLTVHVAPGQLGVTSSVLPWLVPFFSSFGPRDVQALGEGSLRAGAMLLLSLVAHRVARHFQRRQPASA